MRDKKGAGMARGFAVLLAGGSAMLLAGCVESPSVVAQKSSSKEYFSEAAYGVKASPRVAVAGEKVAQRTGRYQLGDAYKVKGRWYKPRLDADYKKVGSASWYGSAFNGRLTANGEVYDMARLTAAHPTMPLPSYARVTNLENGNSVIVRVNDRGPFEQNRIIDLSKRAAQLLDCHDSGLAKVEVAYVGPAPLEGHDDQYLMASYEPGDGGVPNPSIGMPTGVMVAMNGSTPTTQVGGAQMAFASQPGLAGALTLPSSGPIIPDRPETIAEGQAVPLLSYADRRVASATQAFSKVLGAAPSMTAEDVAGSWQRTSRTTAPTPARGYLALGSWSSRDEALREMKALDPFGKPVMEVSQEDGATRYSLSLYADGRYDLDAMLEHAWKAGAPDAFAVRD